MFFFNIHNLLLYTCAENVNKQRMFYEFAKLKYEVLLSQRLQCRTPKKVKMGGGGILSGAAFNISQ